MTRWDPPLAEIRWALAEAAGLEEIAWLPGAEAAEPETVAAVLAEAARFAGDVLAPLDRAGDAEPARLDADGRVRTPPGFAAAYRKFVEGGWNALPFPAAIGGQGLPAAVAAAVTEMWNGANLAFALSPLLTHAAVEAIAAHGTARQKAAYLPKLVSGEWAASMTLTEPQAGSDVGALRMRAVPEGDRFRLSGQKIFITYGAHDLTPNIVHLVLARTPGSPSGTRGLSMFVVPQFEPRPDGTLGPENDVRATRLEHKLGIHGSPTGIMLYGERGGARGELLGEEHRGMENMFTMMNGARLNVGLQGVAVAERAYAQARGYAVERIQGRPIGAPEGAALPIVHHPDVRRMLLTVKATTEAARALAYYAAGRLDRARLGGDAAARTRLDLLIPLVKGWATERAVESCSLALQIHGGMGFIEETGIAQRYRDARILPIYEGTTGIQAMDLVGRKLVRDGGTAARELVAEMRASLEGLGTRSLRPIRDGLAAALGTLERTTAAMLDLAARDKAAAAWASVPYLTLFAATVGGWLLARQARSAARMLEDGTGDPGFARAKLATARFFAEQILPPSAAAEAQVAAAPALAALEPELL